MTYKRKTRDFWIIQQKTCQGWEDVCAEETHKEARQRLREYRENQPEYPVRLKLKRERIEKNPNCDGAHCMTSDGEVRLLPTGADGNAILCRSCFNHEMGWRIERNKDLSPDCQFDLPAWESLKVYE